MATNEATEDQTLDENGNDNDEKQSLSLDVLVESPSDCERHVTVTISREDVDRYFDEAVSELMPTANVPGFRPGRAPRKLVEARFRKDMTEQVKGSLLLDTMNQVTEEQEFSAISEPDFDFDAVVVPEEGPMTFEFDIEVRPEFELPTWKGLSLTKPVNTFTEEDVDNRLEKLLSKHAHMVPHDEAAAPGDYVVVNVTCKHNEQTLQQHEELTLRLRKVLSFRDCRLDDFDQLINGAKGGDRREATVELSQHASNREMRGEQLQIEFEVLEVKKLELPELTEEILAKLGPFGTEEELREGLKTSLERQLVYYQQRQIREQITESLTQSADWELPPDLLKRQSGRELERATLELRASGFDDDAIRAHENELRQNTTANTEKALKEHFILERIAEEEKFEADEADFEQEIRMIATQREESPRRVRAHLEKSGAMDALRNQIIERKVIEQIETHANFKEVPFNDADFDVEAVELTAGGGQEEANIPEAKYGDDRQSLRQPVNRT